MVNFWANYERVCKNSELRMENRKGYASAFSVRGRRQAIRKLQPYLIFRMHQTCRGKVKLSVSF